MGVRGLLLCGGGSVRFGRNKLLEPVAGVPMAGVCARQLGAAVDRVLAVVRPGEPEVREVLLAAGCEVLETGRSLEGLGASLAAGVLSAADAPGWIVMLADMPFIGTDTIRAVRAALEDGALIAAPVHRVTGARGHPVGFARALRDELTGLDGDEGGRSVIARHRESIVLVPVDDPGITRDVDTPADLSRG